MLARSDARPRLLSSEDTMPRGDKSPYSSKEKRKAEHIAEGYAKRGTSKKTAKARAWATVNKESGGGKKSGSGRGKTGSRASSKKGGRKGSSSQSTAKRRAAGKKAVSVRFLPARCRNRAARVRQPTPGPP